MKRREHFFQRSLMFIGIIVLQGIFLFFYFSNLDFIKNFNIFYIPDVYLPLIRYQINQIPHRQSEVKKKNDAQAIPVLLYHSIIESPDGANVLAKNFTEQMLALKEAGYTTIRIKDFLEFMKGTKKLPEHSIVISFDDGSKTTYYPTDPVLATLNYSAVSYLITHFNIGEGSRFYLSSAEIKKMLNTKHWEVQLHTDVGHVLYPITSRGDVGRYYPNKLWKKESQRIETDEEYQTRVREELIAGQKKLEKEFGIRNISFAYPFGDYGQNLTNHPQASQQLYSITKQIFPIVFFQVYKGEGYTYNYPGASEFMRKRIIVQPEWSGKDLIRNLQYGEPKELPFSDTGKLDRGWSGTWGKQSFTKEGMRLQTNHSEGGSVFLDGTFLWKNYHFSTDILWNAGDSFSLLARYKNNNTFLACSTNDSYTSIIQSLEGVEKELNRGNTNYLLRKGTKVHADMVVQGNTVQCKENGKVIVQASGFDPSLSSGGVGFKNWGQQRNQSDILVTNISVTALP